jgi:hypothetical protein
MRTYECDIFDDNHLLLMKCHIWFCILWLLLPIGGIANVFSSAENFHPVMAVISIVVFSLPALMHGLLAYGSYRKMEISRRISEFVFGFLLLAFPVGTFLSMYVCLPATQWKDPKAENE